jgi:hypothetical protein
LKPIYQKIMKIASVFVCITIALVNGKPQPPFLGLGPFHGPGHFAYVLGPVCPEEVCTACEEEGATDIKPILEINCQEGLEDCHAAAKDCSANAVDCNEPLKDCTCHIDPQGEGCTKECLIGPGPCLRKNAKKVGKCVADQAEEVGKCVDDQRAVVGKCVREQQVTLAKCIGDKKLALAKAEECLACAGGCEETEGEGEGVVTAR